MSRFTLQGPQKAVSEDGVIVAFAGRHGLLYETGGYRLTVPCESGRRENGEAGIIAYVSGVTSWDQPAGGALDEADRRKLAADLTAAVTEMGGWCDVA